MHERAHASAVLARGLISKLGKNEEALKVLRRAMKFTMSESDRVRLVDGSTTDAFRPAGIIFDEAMTAIMLNHDELMDFSKSELYQKFREAGQSSIDCLKALSIKTQGLQCNACALEVTKGSKFSFCSTCKVCVSIELNFSSS